MSNIKEATKSPSFLANDWVIKGQKEFLGLEAVEIPGQGFVHSVLL